MPRNLLYLKFDDIFKMQLLDKGTLSEIRTQCTAAARWCYGPLVLCMALMANTIGYAALHSIL